MNTHEDDPCLSALNGCGITPSIERPEDRWHADIYLKNLFNQFRELTATQRTAPMTPTKESLKAAEAIADAWWNARLESKEQFSTLRDSIAIALDAARREGREEAAKTCDEMDKVGQKYIEIEYRAAYKMGTWKMAANHIRAMNVPNEEEKS